MIKAERIVNNAENKITLSISGRDIGLEDLKISSLIIWEIPAFVKALERKVNEKSSEIAERRVALTISYTLKRREVTKEVAVITHKQGTILWRGFANCSFDFSTNDDDLN